MDLEVGGGLANPFANPHPLLIPGVVKKVFQYCGFKELTSCRLVSKDWHENSLKRWRSLAKVKLVGGKDRRYGPMSKFLNFVKREERKNGSFKPYSGHFIIGRVKNLDPFMKGFGLQISALELKDVVFENFDELRKVIFRSCPNMKELALLNLIKVTKAKYVSEPGRWVEPQFGENLNLRRLTLPHNTKSFGITRMEILSHFPSLEVLIQKKFLSSCSYGLNLFEVVEIIRNHDPNKLQLKSIEDLEIESLASFSIEDEDFPDSCFPASFVRLLANAPKLSLEHLAVSIEDGALRAADSLREGVILQQRQTLRKLDLFRHPHHSGSYGFLDATKVFDDELQLENLEELTLRSCVFSSLYFLVAMPNLKKLTIYGMEDFFGGYGNIVKGTRWLSPNIRNLALDKCTELYLGFRLSVKDLELVVRVFPNVEKVTISLDNEMFPVVCGNWTKLVELKVFDSRLDDAGITGLNSVEVSLANQKRSLPTRQGGRRTTPNISCLPRLRRLAISNWEEFPIKRSLGHASASFGFQRVPGLQYLHITNYHVEEDVKEAMRAHATSCVFTRITTDKETLLKRLKEDLF